jgi:hypothetical protein
MLKQRPVFDRICRGAAHGWILCLGVLVGFSALLCKPCAGQSEPHRIRANDTLYISVRREPNLSGWAWVRPDGTITLPLVLSIEVEGLTERRLARRLTERLKPFVKTPTVTIHIEANHLREPSRPRKWLSPPPPEMRQLPMSWPSG